jgi:hypothetical protein
LHTLVFAAAGAWWLRRYVRRAGSASNPPAAPAFGAVYEGPWFTVIALSNWALAGLGRWLVAARFGAEAAGYFTLGGGAATVLTSALGTVWLQYFQPGLYALGDGPDSQRVPLARRLDRAALIYTASAGAALGALVLAGPALVGPLINPSYRAALAWIGPAGAFGLATITAVYYHTLLLAGRREHACAPVDLTTAALLAAGAVAGALAGEEWLRRWMLVSPLVPWLVTRPLARRYFFRTEPDEAAAPAPVR